MVTHDGPHVDDAARAPQTGLPQELQLRPLIRNERASSDASGVGEEDHTLSLATAHDAAFPPTPTTPTFNKASPLDQDPTNWKKQAAGGRTRRKI